MNPVTIVTQALQSIPPNVRKFVLLAYAVVVLVVGILAAVGVDMDYDKITVVLTIIGGYLGVQSGANVDAPPQPVEPEVPEQRGGGDGTPN
jgi:uncharacterized membrane protein